MKEQGEIGGGGGGKSLANFATTFKICQKYFEKNQYIFEAPVSVRGSRGRRWRKFKSKRKQREKLAKL